jgi:predicted nucleotidyltransferase
MMSIGIPDLLLKGSPPSKSTGRRRMGNQRLPQDFREFLKLLNDHKVEYLLIGGYAVGYHGYPRTTADLDVWVATNSKNAVKLVDVFGAFGMRSAEITHDLFLKPGNIVRMGVPPVRIEILNEIDGVRFSDCAANAVLGDFDGIQVPLISLQDLKRNKKASGRHKDLEDLDHLPDTG